MNLARVLYFMSPFDRSETPAVGIGHYGREMKFGTRFGAQSTVILADTRYNSRLQRPEFAILRGQSRQKSHMSPKGMAWHCRHVRHRGLQEPPKPKSHP